MTTTNKQSVQELEQAIAKVSVDLTKLREQLIADATQKVVLAQKLATSADNKLQNLLAKGANTPASKARLNQAQLDADEKSNLLNDAKTALKLLTKEQKAAAKFAKAVAKELRLKSKKMQNKASSAEQQAKAEKNNNAEKHMKKANKKKVNKDDGKVKQKKTEKSRKAKKSAQQKIALDSAPRLDTSATSSIQETADFGVATEVPVITMQPISVTLSEIASAEPTLAVMTDSPSIIPANETDTTTPDKLKA
jgi:hypothetical protein